MKSLFIVVALAVLAVGCEIEAEPTSKAAAEAVIVASTTTTEAPTTTTTVKPICEHNGRGHGNLDYNPGTHTHPTDDHSHVTGECAEAE